jgi:2-keto-4-pentenoate hydratase/2-oxohepta-3-ene-1,7-dioic acid hydratase in catechol pathway
MLFSVAEIIAALSAAAPVNCGDVILTDTPAGVERASKSYLRQGDRARRAHRGHGPPAQRCGERRA